MKARRSTSVFSFSQSTVVKQFIVRSRARKVANATIRSRSPFVLPRLPLLQISAIDILMLLRSFHLGPRPSLHTLTEQWSARKGRIIFREFTSLFSALARFSVKYFVAAKNILASFFYQYNFRLALSLPNCCHARSRRRTPY